MVERFLIDLHADGRHILLGKDAVDEPGYQARFPHGKRSEHTNLFSHEAHVLYTLWLMALRA